MATVMETMIDNGTRRVEELNAGEDTVDDDEVGDDDEESEVGDGGNGRKLVSSALAARLRETPRRSGNEMKISTKILY